MGTVLIEMGAIFQHFLVQNLPVRTAAQTKKIERMRDIAVGEATHDEALCHFVIHNIFKGSTTILEIRSHSQKRQLHSLKNSLNTIYDHTRAPP